MVGKQWLVRFLPSSDMCYFPPTLHLPEQVMWPHLTSSVQRGAILLVPVGREMAYW